MGLLRDHVVQALPDERRSSIEAGLERAAKALGGAPVQDPELVEEVVQLVEWPERVTGSFDPVYLELPRPVVVTAMRFLERSVAVPGYISGK